MVFNFGRIFNDLITLTYKAFASNNKEDKDNLKKYIVKHGTVNKKPDFGLTVRRLKEADLIANENGSYCHACYKSKKEKIQEINSILREKYF